METSGKAGKIFIIDGSPKFINKLSNQLIPKDYTDDDLLEIILVACIKILFGNLAQEVAKEIFAKESAEAKFEEFLRKAAEKGEYSIEYGRKMMNGVFNRIKISLNADKILFEKLKSSTQISLIKPSEASLLDIDGDYGLSDLSDGTIEVKVIEGDHLSILSNFELIQFIVSKI